MAAQRVAMRNIKECLRLKFEAGLSHEKIAWALQLSNGVVSKYVTAASETGLEWPARQLGQLGQSARNQPVNFVIRSSMEFAELQAYVDQLLDGLRDYPGLESLDSDLKLNAPQLKVTINREQAVAIASGAGAESRQQIGRVIVGGLLVGTFFTLFVIPTLYMLLRSWRPIKQEQAETATA